MDYIGTMEKVLTALRQLTSLITPLCSENGDSFIHMVNRFVQNATSALEQMEEYTKKQLNLMLGCILSTAWLVVQNMSSNAAFDAIKRVTREVRSMFDGRMPEYMVRDYDVLERLLAAASEKLTGIQSTCNLLLGEVINACDCQWRNPMNFRRLEACRLRASADIRDCEQSLNSAHEIIELLQRKTSEQLVELGRDLAFFAAFSIGLGFSAARALQAGARLTGGILSCAGVGGALACVAIGKKFSDHFVVWEEVRNKRSQYRQLSTRLECLKETVERDLKAGILLTSMPDLEKAIILSLAFLVAFGGILFAYILVK